MRAKIYEYFDEDIIDNATLSYLNMRNVIGDTKLHTLVRRGQAEHVAKLLQRGVEVDPVNKLSETPLQIAVDRGYIDIVELLLNHHANINYIDKDGNSILHSAVNAQAGPAKLKVIELISNLLRNVNLLNNNYESPLNYAVKLVDREMADKVVKLLLDKGALPSFRDNKGATIYDKCDSHLKRVMEEKCPALEQSSSKYTCLVTETSNKRTVRAL